MTRTSRRRRTRHRVGTTDTYRRHPPRPRLRPTRSAPAVRLRDRVAVLVERRSAADPTAADPLRGLYLSEDAVRHSAAAGRRPAPGSRRRTGTVDGSGDGPRATATGARLAGAPRADRAGRRRSCSSRSRPTSTARFEPLYGYLNDDVSRRRATVGLALDLCGLPAHHAEARARFHPTAPLTALRPAGGRGARTPLPQPLVARTRPAGRASARRRDPGRRARRPCAPQLPGGGPGGRGTTTVFLRSGSPPGWPAPRSPLSARAPCGRRARLAAAAALRASGQEALHFTPGAGRNAGTEPIRRNCCARPGCAAA